jgi:hypothetical protein
MTPKIVLLSIFEKNQRKLCGEVEFVLWEGLISG